MTLESALLDERTRIQDEIQRLEERLIHVDYLLGDTSDEIEEYSVISGTDYNVNYKVTYNKRTDQYTCDCPDYVYRSKKDADHICKHIKEFIN